MKSSLLSAAVLGLVLSTGSVRADTLLNSSSRGNAGPGASSLITGFVANVPPGQLQWFLVRAVGPTLANFGVNGALMDPALTIYDSNGTAIATNSAWGTAPNLSLLNTVTPAVGAFALGSANDAAILVGVPAGSYTAVTSSKGTDLGQVLNEVYNVAPVTSGQTSQTITGLAASNPNLTILTAALRATGLDAVLAQGGPVTVFAPTDAAFNALPAGTLSNLLANPAQLAAILKYHVASGAVLSSALTNGEQITTLNGAKVSVSISGSTVSINSAQVVIPDVKAVNGVVHVINQVLLPPGS